MYLAIRLTRTSLVSLAILCLSSSTSAAQAPLSWSWFRATTSANNWWITEGRADVAISGNSFTATLWDGNEQNFARISLKGTLRSHVVAARVTVNNTDVDPTSVTGRLRRSCWQGGGGRETLLLSDGFDVIGLFRELPSGHCVPIK